MSRTFAPAFETFVGPARARPQAWRLIVGLVIAAIVYVAWVAAVLGAYWLYLGRGPLDRVAAIAQADTPERTLVLLSTFGGMALGPMVAVRLLHRRSIASLFGYMPRVLRDFATAIGISGTVFGLALVGWLLVFDTSPNLALGTWLWVLPIALILLGVQTLAEELVFRGYLLQQLAVLSSSKAIWLVLPAVVFGLAHYDPATMGGNLWYVVAATFIFGLAAADLTVRSGTIGAAWGLHFANNLFAILIVSMQGALGGLSLLTAPFAADDPILGKLILVDIATVAIAWALIRSRVSR